MPDAKISALTAITTLTPATDVLPVVDVTGTTKKITTNQILGSGGTATLASATITGDLTVDTSTLKVDSANNRVGIGTATPNRNLTLFAAASPILQLCDSTSGTTANDGLLIQQVGVDTYLENAEIGSMFFRTSATTRYSIDSTGVSTWSVGGSTAMTLNSTGLGVGGSPVRKFTAYDTSSAYQLRLGFNTSFYYDIGRSSSDGLFDFYGAQSGATGYRFGGVDGTRMTIDTSGNVGIGVTPSAWAAGYKVIQGQIGGFALSNDNSSNNQFRLSSNAYFDTVDNRWEYYGTSTATAYEQRAGEHRFFNAASGTVNTAITFTQTMTLDASGNLLVGTTSAGGNRLNVQTASGDCTALIKSQAANVGVTIDYVSNYGNFNFAKSGTAKWSLGILNDSASTPTFKLFNDAAVGVYVTYGGTSWTATSDERLKDIIEPISNAVAKVGSLRSVIGKFKSDDTNTRRSFLIAQDVQAVLPEAVDASNPDKLGVAYTDVIPLLVAAIKELTARVQTLETR